MQPDRLLGMNRLVGLFLTFTVVLAGIVWAFVPLHSPDTIDALFPLILFGAFMAWWFLWGYERYGRS